MERRQKSIIYHLATSDSPLTADELAKRLAVSKRTIKSEMSGVRQELLEEGALLIAKRNEGYSISVTDDNKFQPFFESLILQSTLTNNFASDDEACFLYVARKLVSSSRFVKLEDIADELYTSKSALRSTIKSVMEFLETYHLIAESKPGLGIRIYGKEHHMRLAMTELFAVHFHKVLLDNAGMEYAKWIDCDYEERQNIRHCFLKVLRESSIKIGDVNTQRLSIYFIIARNRCRAGYRLNLPEQWLEIIRQYEEYGVAEAIYEDLRLEFEDFNLPWQETAFLSIYLISCRDPKNPKEIISKYPDFCEEAEKLAWELVDYVKETCRLNLQVFDWVFDELCSILITVLAIIHFELNGLERFSYSYDNQILKSPVAVELSFVIIDFLESRLGEPLSSVVFSRFTAFIFKIISFTQFDIKKMKLLLVSFDGINANEITKMRVKQRYDKLIESYTFAELYEIRGFNQEEYDAVLINANQITYNYNLPYCVIGTLAEEKEMYTLYNKILIHAFQIQELLLDSDQIEINKDFIYANESEFIQFISFRHALDENSRKAMQEWYRKPNWHFKPVSKTAVLFWQNGSADKIELYCLKNSGLWHGEEIEYILYIQANWEFNWKKVKIMENSLRQLLSNPQFVNRFEVEKDVVLKEMVQRCLKYE